MAETLHAYKAEPYSYAEARALSAELGLSDPVAIALVRRGYRTPEEARAFLDADESHEPGEFRSMATVVERVLGAIQAGGGSRSTATSTSTASAPPRSWSAACASLAPSATG